MRGTAERMRKYKHDGTIKNKNQAHAWTACQRKGVL